MGAETAALDASTSALISASTSISVGRARTERTGVFGGAQGVLSSVTVLVNLGVAVPGTLLRIRLVGLSLTGRGSLSLRVSLLVLPFTAEVAGE